MNFLCNKTRNQVGFSVLEVTVALGIIAVGLLGVSSLVIQNIQAETVNRNYLIASMLAQEGLELVRNIRDENWKTGAVYSTDIVDIDGFIIDYQGRSSIDYNINDINNSAAILNIDTANSIYSYEMGVPSIYSRLLTSIDNGTYLAVTSTVQWKNAGRINQYAAVTYLYDWR